MCDDAYSISGERDYLLHLLVRDVADLEDLLIRRVFELECVSGTATICALRRIKHTNRTPT